MRYICLVGIVIFNFSVLSQISESELKKIEHEFGEQWDFCTCVIKNDSIMERLKTLDLAKEELDIILDQLNEIELKCQAFLLMDPTETAEERAMHARRVKDCLEEE